MKLFNCGLRFKGIRALSFLFIVSVCCFSFTLAAYAQAQRASRVRTVSESPAAEATLTLNEQFLNSFLDAMFTQLREPEFPLSISRNEDGKGHTEILASHASSHAATQCASVIVLERERNGVKTAVRFEDGRMVAPLAFSGSYNAGLLGCLNFNGVANSIVTLEFDRAREAMMARVRVQDVQLTGVPTLANGVLVSLLQNTIDKRFNPYQLFKAEQLSPVVQLKAAGGSLRLRAREMRPEIIPGALRLHIIYEFVRAEGNAK